jgi:hypothetical protein
MADEPAPAPAVPSTSLSNDAAGEKAQIESWMAEGLSGPYYRGTDSHSAQAIQSRYQDLIRGELAGADNGVGPEGGPDLDLPLHASGYDLSCARGFITTGEQRDLADSFAKAAYEGGLGQKKFAEALQWSADPAITPQKFAQLARSASWSDAAIGAVLQWHAAESRKWQARNG